MTGTTSIESINIDFVVNGKEHRLKCDTRNRIGNKFRSGQKELCFKIAKLRGEELVDMETSVATTAFETIWNTGYEILFDLELNLTKEGHTAVLERCSIKPVAVLHLKTGLCVDEELWDQELLKPFKEGKIIRTIARTQVKGSNR